MSEIFIVAMNEMNISRKEYNKNKEEIEYQKHLINT